METRLRRKLATVFICMVTLSLLFCSGIQKADAATCGYPNGPKTGTMIADVNEWKTCSTMPSLTPPGEYWMTLSNMPAGSILTNGTYGSYCVDLAGTIMDNPQEGNIVYTVDFWSSLDPNLPTAVKQVKDKQNITYTISWDKINYLLNKYPDASWLNQQAAYWDLVHGCTQSPGSLYTCGSLRPAPYYFPYGPSAPYGCQSSNPPLVDEVKVQSMVNDANANGSGFIPKAGDKIASVGQITNCTPDTICNQRLPYQVFFIPTTCPTCTGSVGDFVWNDLNGNGVQDSSEPGISDVEVKLTGTDDTGQPINLTTKTDKDGKYLFTGLCSGKYRVAVDSSQPALANLDPTINRSANGDDNKTSDSNEPSGTSVTITTDTSSNLTVDFGYVPRCSGSIGNLVWKDIPNENGMYDSGEPVLSGVTLSLSGTNVYGVTVNMTATTNGSGLYSFDGLCQGNYTVKVDSGIPAGFIPTTSTSSTGDDLIDNDSNNPAGTTVKLLADNISNPTVDFGYVPDCKGSIGDFVWEDLNKNGTQDTGEPGIDGVVVNLSGTNAYNQLVSMTETTKNGGIYTFHGVCKGTYTVTINPSTVPAGWIPTTPRNTNGSDGNGTDSNEPNGTTVTMTDDTTSNLNVDFGYIPDCKATIGNFVWEDKNGDGIQNDLNSGLDDVQVLLTGINFYGQAVNLSINTADGGYYQFTGLCKGDYTVSVTKPQGLEPTSPLSSNGNDGNATDSNNPIGTSVKISDNASSNQTVDFGYIKLMPKIDIRKQAEGPDSRTFPAGSNVPFEIAVTNTGNVILTGVVVTDAQVPGCGKAIGNLNPGQTVTYTCTVPSVMKSFTNTSCTEAMYGNTKVTDCDDSTVKVPSIDIRKQAEGPDSRTFPAGSNVPFEIAVTNTSDVILTGVVVTDAQVPGCGKAIGNLNPGQTVTYTCTANSVTNGFTNTACTEGTYGAIKVTDCDDSTVVIPKIDVKKYISIDGKTWFHTDLSNILKVALCPTCEEDYDKDHCDYNHDGKCDEKDVDYCRYNKSDCDKHDSEHGSSKRKHRCDDSSNKSYCDDKARDAHERDHSDYNNDGKCDERDIDYCKANKAACDRHDADHRSTKRAYRCDDSSNKTWCGSRKQDEDKSDKGRSDYNRDGKCNERDVDYCRNNSSTCDKFDGDRGNLKRTFRCDDSSNKTWCESKAQTEHNRDYSDYNHDGKCDDRDIDHCKNNPAACDRHDRDRGGRKHSYRCDDSSDKTRCESRSKGEGDWYDGCINSGGTPSTCGKVYFKFVVTDTGTTALTGITLSDSMYSTSSCTKPATLQPGGSFACIIGPLPAQAGQHTDTATASGTFNNMTVQATDKAYYYGCNGTTPKSPGYWKNHPEAWPVASIIIGGKTYTKAQAIDLMSSSVSGDKTFTLFKALVAAKLDAMGCSDASCVAETMVKADAWMALHPVGSGVPGDSTAWKVAEPLYLILDDYVNGKLCGGTGSCTPPPPPAPTCGKCSGGVTKLTLMYKGWSSAMVVVKDSSGQELFNGTVAPNSSFIVSGKVTNGTMGQYVKIYVNGSYKSTITTDCSKAIYSGMGVGSFTVVEGYSLNGGKFCRVPTASCTSDDDDHYSKDYCDSHNGESSCSDSFDYNKNDSYSSRGNWSSHD